MSADQALEERSERLFKRLRLLQREHRAKLHSTNPIERLNWEIKRRTEVVGIFPNEAAITRLIGAIIMGRDRTRLCSPEAYCLGLIEPR